MQAIGGQFRFAPVYHCIEQADGGISRKFFHAYVLFRKNTFVQQFGTFGPFQQRMLRSMPMAAVKEGDVGDAGVGEQMPAYNQNIIIRAAPGKQPVECTAVGAFSGVVDVVGLYQCQ